MKTIVLSLFILSACTSLPKGELQLKKMMIDDQPKEPPGRVTYVHSGRPLYVESTSYPFLLPDGHISLKGKLLVYVGREELSLNELLPKQEEKKKASPSKPSEVPKNETKERPPIFREMGGGRLSVTPSLLFPKTPGAESFQDYVQLKNSSIKKKDQKVVNHYKCAKPKIIKNGDCTQLQVEFDLSQCFGSPFIKQGYKVNCLKDEALFGVRLNNVRYRIKTQKTPKALWSLHPQVQVTFYRPQR